MLRATAVSIVTVSFAFAFGELFIDGLHLV